MTEKLFSWSYLEKANLFWWSLLTSVDKGTFDKSILTYPGMRYLL